MSFRMVLLERLFPGSIRFVLLALGPIAAIAFHGYIMLRYRNAGKPYQFEKTTHVEPQDVQGSDTYLESIGRAQEKHVEGHKYPKEPRNRLRTW